MRSSSLNPALGLVVFVAACTRPDESQRAMSHAVARGIAGKVRNTGLETGKALQEKLGNL